MRADEIIIGRTYVGGKNNDLRTVVSDCYNPRFILWAPTCERLPLGGFIRMRTTRRESFAKWAVREHYPPEPATSD